MTDVLLAMLYGLAVMAAMLGYGALVTRIVSPRQDFDAPQQAALGMAVFIAIGGWLELTRSISPRCVLGLVGAGLVLCGWRYWGDSRWLADLRAMRRQRSGLLLVWAGMALVLSALYFSWSYSRYFNPGDDFHGYLAFPLKMLEAGGLGDDPFSARRLACGLGGQSFLQALVIAAFPLTHINLIDPGCCLVILAGMIVAEHRRRGDAWTKMIPALLLLALIDLQRMNISATYSTIVFVFGIYRTLAHAPTDSLSTGGRAVLLALLTSAVCTLKSTVVPTVGLMLAISYLIFIVETASRRRALVEGALVLLLTTGLMLPWMLSLYHSNSTLLYPLLGPGTHGSQYGEFWSPTAGLKRGVVQALQRPLGELAQEGLFQATLLMIAGACWLLPQRDNPRRPWLSLSVSALVGTIAMTLATGGNSSLRYSAPLILAALLALAVELSSQWKSAGGGWRWVQRAGLAGIVLVLLPAVKNSVLESIDRMWMVRDEWGLPLIKEQEAAPYQELQASVPAGAPLLLRLDYNFLVDFARNPIYISDYPGDSNPRPGMPFFRGPAPLAEYLQGHSIRYVAYAYANEAGYSFAKYGSRATSWDPWTRDQARFTFDFQDNLALLRKSHNCLYDDGKRAIIDLASPRQQPAPAR